MSNAEKAWAERPVNVDFLIDSGLLFQVNLEFFHPLGIALTARRDEDGTKSLAFKDMRTTPGEAKFDQDIALAGKEKMNRFLAEYGRAQLTRRKRAFGREVQIVNPKD